MMKLGSVPKPLIPLAGKPLLQWVIEGLQVIEPHRLIVVVGYKHRYIEEFLTELECDPTIEIITTVNPEYERENGYSLLQTEDIVGDRFLVVMADHVVDPRIYQKAAAHYSLGLCVDRKKLPSKEDTKVFIKEGKIVQIGKDLRRYNGVDCGVFMMTLEIFSALKFLEPRRKITLTDAVTTLIKWEKDFKAIDVSGLLWADIDTPQDLAWAEETLCKR